MRKNFAIVVSIVAIAMMVALLAPLQYGMPATAAPAFAPTPVAGVLPGDSTSKYVEWLKTRVITQDMVTGCVPVSGFDLFDLQWKSDQGGASNNNTTTLTLLYTNDQVTFDVGPAIVAANTADANDMQQFASFGRFACVDVNVTNSRNITLTVNALVK